jgi:hypothetical protein
VCAIDSEVQPPGPSAATLPGNDSAGVGEQLWWMWVFSTPQAHEVESGTGEQAGSGAQGMRGNRTPRAAQTQSVLVSFQQTCRNSSRHPL